LGSTDSWSKPQFNYSIPIDNSQNYAFQALATNLRGFQQNIRNGNSFAVINSELRIPLFKYLMSRPIKSDFIKNFQVIGFFDAGSAWTGKSPWADSNSLNSNVIESPPFTITLVNQRQPIVAGYGYGLRSRVLGYFARLDWAWGFENGKTNKPRMLYFSLGMDF
jgi:outer membrane protein assembly factor BamA